MKLTITAILTDNYSLEYNREELSKLLRKLKRGVVNIMIADEKLPDELKLRSKAQNAYYWGVVCKHAAACFSEVDGLKYSTTEAHERLKLELNPINVTKTNQRTGEGVYITIGGSTKDKTTVEFEDYISKCRLFLSEWFGVYVPLPNEPPQEML
jgi:hypothetical protein